MSPGRSPWFRSASVPRSLPTVLGRQEVDRLIQCTPNLKHRTFLMTLYAAGLRFSEAANLKIHDIDSKRMQIRVACGKGKKERLVPLSPRLLKELRVYWLKYKPTDFLFPGKTPSKTLRRHHDSQSDESSGRRSRASNARIYPHVLRHSYATGLLEAGVDLLTISKLLGHASFITTMVYLHCRREHLGSAPSPLDWLPVRQLPTYQPPPENGADKTLVAEKLTVHQLLRSDSRSLCQRASRRRSDDDTCKARWPRSRCVVRSALGGHWYECDDCHEAHQAAQFVWRSALSGLQRCQTTGLHRPSVHRCCWRVSITTKSSSRSRRSSRRWRWPTGSRSPICCSSSAWKALGKTIRSEQGYDPAALMVLHTWNQKLDSHWHVHALVPGGGPSFADGSWTEATAPL